MSSACRTSPPRRTIQRLPERLALVLLFLFLAGSHLGPRSLAVGAELARHPPAVGAELAAPLASRGLAQPLRVCADPNNMPFSERSGRGFENKIAELVARDLERPLTYTWAPQRRGFLRNTLNAHTCDVVIGVPAQYGPVQSTRAYYRSSYAFVSQTDRHLGVRSFDDPRLKSLTIGIQITGDDYANPPAAQALAARHLVQNVRGYTV